MTETTQPDYIGMAREEVASLEDKRGLVAAELEECERLLSELRTRRKAGAARRGLRDHLQGCGGQAVVYAL
jgi:hypothetical protein